MPLLACLAIRSRRSVAWQLAVVIWATCAGFVAAQEARWQITVAELGFGGRFKLGCWTQLQVTLEGGADALQGLVEATLTDADGVQTSFRAPPERVSAVSPGQTTSATLLVRVGQQASPLTVRFRGEDGQVVAERTFGFGYEAGPGTLPYGLPSTARVMLGIGAGPALDDVVRSAADDGINADGGTVTALAKSAADLPLSWLGYESIDTLVVAAREAEFFRDLPPDSARLAALVQWVEQGGKVVVLGGAESEETLGPQGSLAALLPGRWEGLAPLRDRDAIPIETFGGSNEPLARGRVDIRVPRLVDVQGEILAYVGREPTDLPLVIRARRGLGLVTFAAFDPQAPPLDRWSGREPLLRRLVGWPVSASTTSDGMTVQAGYPDLMAQLRAALDVKFVGVEPVPFALVALLVALYIALIGPGDFFLVKYVFKRMEVTWVTFPLIAVGVSAFAYWLAGALKGDQLRVNHVEIVDVDAGGGTARGTVWTHFFSPRVNRYDLSLQPKLGRAAAAAPSVTAAWLGDPGEGMGGMQAQGGQGLFSRGYEIAPQLDRLIDVPVQEWSTKTITARWTADAAPLVEADLRRVRDELLAGTLVNRSGFDLQDCLLLYGNWAYRLTTVNDGATRNIDERLQPRTVKTLLTNSTAGEEQAAQTADDGTVKFEPYGQDVVRLVKLMMFYEATGGEAYSPTLQRYQAFVDLSYLLNSTQAILLARAPAEAASGWQMPDGPLASDADRHWVFYRFVLPVQPESAQP